MQIQDLTAGLKRKKPIHVVAPINNPRSQEVAEHLVTEGLRVGMPCSMDLLLPSELSSGVLTQVNACTLYFNLWSGYLLTNLQW